jgi:hypothetical protein
VKKGSKDGNKDQTAVEERPVIDFESVEGCRALRRYVWLLSERLRGGIARIVIRTDDGQARLITLMRKKRP